MKNIINIGLIGFGTIGTGVVKALKERASFLEKRVGVELKIKTICDRDIISPRDVEVEPAILTTDVNKVINDPEIKIVIELVGGLHPAKEFIIRSLGAGKHVITANKALLAETMGELFQIARDNDVDLYFEASVGGGIPIIKALREGLIANHIHSIFGIVNGTSNYILTKMTEESCDFKVALQEAQEKGYAEKDPTLDIKGIDSAHKLTILATLGFGIDVRLSDIYVEGILDILPNDIRYADELGCVIKLLAIAKRVGEELEVRVHPTLIPKEHLLSSVKGVFNAIYVSGDMVGNILLYGRGAGQRPTTSAVISDIVDIARNIIHNSKRRIPPPIQDTHVKRIKRMEEIETRCYIRFSAIDRPGVFAQITRVLGEHNISIASVIQKERMKERIVPIVMLTHEADELNIRQAIQEIDLLPIVKRKSVVIRMEKEE